ncbi:MAG: hypothetical protein COW71_05035 [Ignavibacteriales bacterium CG18_big_fil_WC_8_21_14_2_50_31_20]|nr:MAG: hypothetical protein COW71_05035 [Ignavibacteriales bacterium CG18_big_fil_WC_8_21_14_2_50_31_20]
MRLELLDIINIITIAPLFLYSGFLFFSKKANAKSNRFLSYFLFTNGVYLLNFLFVRLREQIDYNLIFFFYIGSSFSFIFGPSLLFYTKSIAYKNFRLQKKDVVHFIPFFLSLLYYFMGLEEFGIEYYGIKYFQIIIYFIPIFKIIQEYNSRIKDYFSAIESLNLKRLVVIYVVFLILWGIDVSDYISIAILGTRNFFVGTYLIYTSLIINFVFANLLLIFSLTHSENQIENEEKATKYKNSNLDNSQKKEYSIKLKDLLEQEKVFLKNDLTLNHISSKLEISTRNLSQIINEIFQKNFYDLINFYRVEEAKKALLTHGKNKTILEIIYEVGFNSKSAFNTAFRKNTGLTPSEFKQKFGK